MDIVIKNCNNINKTIISLYEDTLNIKYGANGTGKSTIVKAIELATTSENHDISSLMPFKFIGKSGNEVNHPSIDGLSSINSVSVFNEEYVNQFVFKQDEVVNNSFEIFIKTKEYDKKMEEIEKLVSEIKNTFEKDDRIDRVINDLTALSDSFGKSKKGIHASGRIGKGLGSGNKLEHIPENLTSYEPFLKMPNNVKWIGWQIKGNEFMDISTDCPYCTSPTEDKKETILSVKQEYNPKSIEHLNKLLEILASLGKYFSPLTTEKLNSIIQNKDGLSEEQENCLLEIKQQIDVLRNKLSSLKSISFFSFKDDEKVQDKISSLKIDLNFLSHIDSEDTKSIVICVNQSLDLVLKDIGLLQGEVNKQKTAIQKTIQKHNSEINSFLKYAGYEYYVDIEKDGDSYKMRLKHNDSDMSIDNSSRHLSFGERNAFSLVLFMYESLAKNPDLIVLDDPISSFDKNKKFAIVEMLFRRQDSFQEKTVLMMTHDFEPIIDIVSTFHGAFQPIPRASFLRNTEGVVTEIEIVKNDIVSCGQICIDNMQSEKEDIIKLIYLRRYYEIMNNKGNEYQLLSNLFHKRNPPIVHPEGVEMLEESIASASVNIRENVNGFDYITVLDFLNNQKQMKHSYRQAGNCYEKLQIFRIIDNLEHNNSVIKKFINETLHIENDYIMQLDPSKYEFIPQYIMAECDRIINA